jgi:predicted NACHT family NTPase
VVGGPGTGKTSFCYRNALSDAEHHANDSSQPIPVYVPLHRLARVDLTSFEHAFLGSNSLSTLLPSVERKSRSAKIRCYLDGMDEIPSLKQRDSLLALALQGSNRPGECQVVLTARDYLYDQRLNALPRVQLSGLGKGELMALAKGWLEDDLAAVAFMDQVGKSPAISGLVRVPLLATVTILIFKRTRRIPESRSRLYSTFVSLLCGGWDLAKGIVRPTRFGVDAKQVVLSCLADHLHQSGLREFDPKLFRSVVRGALGSHISHDSDALLEEVLRDGIITRSGPELHFCHLSIQEFLTAKFRLGDPSRKGLTASLRRFLDGEDWWREVLRFYIGLSDNPQAVQKWLDSNVATSDVLRCDFLYDALAEAFPHFSVRRSSGDGKQAK